MKKSLLILPKVINVVFIIALSSVACQPQSSPAHLPSQTPQPTKPPLSFPTPSEISPTETAIPPTFTPTLTPVIQPLDFMLTVKELPIELFKSYAYEYLNPDGSTTYYIMFFNASVGKIQNSLTVAAQPYLEIPGKSLLVDKLIEDSLLNENSIAYEENGYLTYTFFKGNVLVSIVGYLQSSEIARRGELTLEEMVNLGKIVEERLPDMLPLSPITFPKQLDQGVYDQYLKTVALSKQVSGSNELIPSTIFSPKEQICLSMEQVSPAQPFEYTLAIYDVQEEVYIQKFIPTFSGSCAYTFTTRTGPYEVHLAINDTLVAILPFEVQ